VSVMPRSDSDIILRADNLSRNFDVPGGLFDRLRGIRRILKAVDGVDLAIRRGEIFAIVGETGSGKSTLARLLLRLLAPTGGTLEFTGEDAGPKGTAADLRFRRRAQVVFQDPYSALDPRMRVGAQIREPLDIHRVGPRSGRDALVLSLLDRVGLGPEQADAYPADLSGGQRQRVSIALALAPGPEIIVADEPTSALDLSVQAQVLNLLSDLQRDDDLTIVFITHDLGVVRHFCDRVAVMYLGRIVEQAPTATLFASPGHPYTQALFAAIPDHDPTRRAPWPVPIGDPPSPLSPPTGCAFHLRCPAAMARCATKAPALRPVADGRAVACHLFDTPSPPSPAKG
jgi:oligopeptide transport system ATP-binding protein